MGLEYLYHDLASVFGRSWTWLNGHVACKYTFERRLNDGACDEDYGP